MTHPQASLPSPADVLEFWFGTLNDSGRADSAHSQRWWRKDPSFDASIRERFAPLHAAIANGERETWLEQPRERLAYVIVLDQFSRNMFRDTARMFAADARALDAARGGVAHGDDRRLAADERSFLYMPFMHSEALADQERCIELFAQFARELPESERESARAQRQYAERHRDIVRRFGRFPHRNRLLGRESTPEEQEFLKQPGSAF